MSDTLRTEKVKTLAFNGNASDYDAYVRMFQHAEQLERELAEVTKQRDALAEALQWYEKKVCDCRKVTPEGHFARYKLDEDGGKIAAKALAATKGGSHE
jgi:hypothetical protein